jgi:enoyl-CoA hydratase/carnithine racemase
VIEEVVVRRGNPGVTTIVINRPAKRNALTLAMYDALADALADCDADAATAAVVLTGTGGSFTAGNDLEDFIAGPYRPADGGEAPVRRFQEAVLRARPVLVAAVDGPAVGIGATVLLHCDLVYATARSYLRAPFVDLGVVPEFAASLLLPRRIGPQRAAEFLLLGSKFSAERACALGLVNEVLADEGALLARAAEVGAALAAKPATALATTRSLLCGHPDQDVRDRYEEEGRLFAERLADPETAAAMRAVLDRRR